MERSLKSLLSLRALQPTSAFTQSLNTEYVISDTGTSSIKSRSQSLLQEGQSDQRFVRSMNPIFKYDFKVGNYIPDDVKKMNPHLFNTIKDVTTGIRKSS